MKKILLFALTLTIGTFAYFSYQNWNNDASIAMIEHDGEAYEEGEEDELPKRQRIKEALEWNAFLLKDESLGYAPYEELVKALDFTRRRQREMLDNPSRGTTEEARWRERGPNNIGGRTRTILYDLNDPTRKKVWAGGVTGGLWWTEDVTAQPPIWNKVNDWFSNIAVGAMAQDPSNPDVMYMGTGEGHTSEGGFIGYGIFKSTDGGDTWDILPSTAFGTTSNFQYTQALLVHPETGDVYAATSSGLRRSQNGGNSWEILLSVNNGGVSSFFYDLQYAGDKLWASNRNSVFRSDTGNQGEWTNLASKPGFPNNLSRVEVTVCESDPNVMYLVGASGGGASSVYASFSGGEGWTQRAQPTHQGGAEFTNGQVWYDLDISVDPFDCNHVFVAGVPLMQSFDGCVTLGRLEQANYSPTGHPDQHLVLFDNENEGRVLHGNDGGIWYRNNFDQHQVMSKNNGYNVTQYYACAFHPEAYSNYMLGGTQDNGSHQLNDLGVTHARNVWGGDGFFCHIDQNDPNYQFVSSQFGNFGMSTNGGISFSGVADTNGRFNTPSDFDSDDKILYAQTGSGSIYRAYVNPIDGVVGQNGPINLSTNITPIISITADPNTPHRVYVGSTGGRVYRLDNAHGPVGEISVNLVSNIQGNVVSIDIADGDPNHLLITMSNFGLNNSIYESTNGGDNWVGVEGTNVPNNLPNVPVRWGVFNPANPQQAMIATEVGVWATDLLDGANTVWYPPFPGKGTPLVRTDMLRVRKSDRMVLAGTYGRGLWTCDLWADPKVILSVPRVGYIDGDLFFNGSASINADSYEWDLGDGSSSTNDDFYHSYGNIGTYDVALTINDDANETEEGEIKILPDLPVPYEAEEAAYGGSFESNSEQWGVHTHRGTGWERGNSTVSGKDGTHTGSNAFVTGLTGPFEDNSLSILYMPNFDMNVPGIYEFGFWTKHELGAVKGGFIVEYSLDRGTTWRQLGDKDTRNWYNYDNEDSGAGAFPFGTPYFGSNSFGWKEKKMSVSHLSGNDDVAFRFVFRSSAANGAAAGAVIDDVVLTRFDGEAKTAITQCDAQFSQGNSQQIDVTWVTRPEFYAQKFIIERSTDALEYEAVETVLATGITTAEPQSYSAELLGLLDTYFIRIRGISTSEQFGIADTIVTPVKVVRRNPDEPADIMRYYPNPLQDDFTIIFNDLIEENVNFRMYDVAGRLIFEKNFVPEGALTTLNTSQLPPGNYFLNYQIGEGENKTLKLQKLQ